MTQHQEYRMRSCPSFNRCSAPVCPLETIYPSPEREWLPGEKRCVATKPTRYTIGVGLKFHGLFAREYNSTERMGGFGKLDAAALHKNEKCPKSRPSGGKVKAGFNLWDGVKDSLLEGAGKEG